MSVGVAIIGGGIFAREEHLPAVEAAEHLTLKAVYSRSLKSAQSLTTDSTKVDLYSDDSGSGKGYADLLKRDDIHAVIIALPIMNQPLYIRQALEAGKHVLSEKPIAPNVADARELISWYSSASLPSAVHGGNSKPTWGIAENYRFLNTIAHANGIANGLGSLQTFGMRMTTLLTGGKYFETSWRKTPTHQGGFVLDAGVHFVAALRQLIAGEKLSVVSAFSRQNQKHLPPLDTIDAILRTESGATGTVSISFGTTSKGFGYWLGYEKGSIDLEDDNLSRVAAGKKSRGKMNIITTKGEDVKSDVIEDEGTGVKPEIRAWGEALAKGTVDPRQDPEQALADLEVLEAIFTSGSQGGQPQHLKCQI